MPNHLAIAVAARNDPKARCDAFRLVDAVLPLFLDGHQDFAAGDHALCADGGLVSALMDAKFYFYDYEAGWAQCAR